MSSSPSQFFLLVGVSQQEPDPELSLAEVVQRHREKGWQPHGSAYIGGDNLLQLMTRTMPFAVEDMPGP